MWNEKTQNTLIGDLLSTIFLLQNGMQNVKCDAAFGPHPKWKRQALNMEDKPGSLALISPFTQLLRLLFEILKREKKKRKWKNPSTKEKWDGIIIRLKIIETIPGSGWQKCQKY